MEASTSATLPSGPTPILPAVRTTCPYCGVGCGLVVSREPTGAVNVAGDPEHPANLGRLCSKGAALGETLDLDGRLLTPEIGGRQVSWPAALDAAAVGLSRIQRQYGPDAIAFYVSGQLLTEDYYVANKLMKGFLGSSNIDTNSRLCMSSAVSGHKRAFGADAVPGCYEDLELADLVLLVGSNAAWCHPVLYQRLAAAKARRPDMRVVVIDPRRTATCDLADLHLPVQPGTDGILFNGLLAHLAGSDAVDRPFVLAHTVGFDAAVAEAARTAPSAAAVATAAGVPKESVETLYRWFARTERVVTAFSQGINQSSSGTDKINAIINCHLATGRIGRPGMGPFSLTGQPNAMGGREVGGLATQLAAHLDFGREEDWDRLRRFWGAPNLARRPGHTAIDLFRAVREQRIRAVWIMATNPAVSMPDADDVRAALRDCELVIVSDCVRRTDTAEHAHILLPAAAWGEKDGTVTNSERRISRQRAFLPTPGDARPDWWIVTQVARRMGFHGAFPYRSASDIFREHAALSAFENGGARVFNLQALAGHTNDQYDAMAPVQWPVTDAMPAGTERLFASGDFATACGRARFVAVTPCLPRHPTSPSAPLVLNSGRVRDQWHTMTRTGKTPRLLSHQPEPYAELHPADAQAWGIEDGAWVRVLGNGGHVIVRARVSDAQRPGSLFVPIHWNGQTAGQARIGACIGAVVDPVSGQPELKHAPVAIEPYHPRWEAQVLSRAAVLPGDAALWVAIRERSHWRTRLAGDEVPADWEAWLHALLAAGRGLDCIAAGDTEHAQYRAAYLRDGRLEAYASINLRQEALPLEWLRGLFGQDALSTEDQRSLLSGPVVGVGTPDPIVCSCHAVGAGTITKAIAARGLKTAADVGALLHAGTQCGSCLPEIRLLLAAASGNGRS